MNNENAKRLNFRKGSKPRSPSQTNGNANILIKSNIAIPKLQNLAKKYIGVVDPHGFLTDLRIALNIPNTKGVSKYGYITIPKEDGSVLQASLRITNHNSNANTYITNNTNMDYNLSIVVRNKQRQNTFVPHKDVVLDEYVYYGKRMEKVENPLTQIINSIIGFLQSGVYEDTTNVAFRNHSPQQDENNKLNCNIMKKNVIRLTESDLHKIVKESVNKILNESNNDYNKGFYTNDNKNGVVTDALGVTFKQVRDVYFALYAYQNYDESHHEEFEKGLRDWWNTILSNARRHNRRYIDNPNITYDGGVYGNPFPNNSNRL